MNTAAVSEITTQTVAIRRDLLSSELLRIAMKRRSTWGTPKYPRPHEAVESMVRKPYSEPSPKSGEPLSACCTPLVSVTGFAIAVSEK